MAAIRVARVGPESAQVVFDLVDRLLQELGEEGDETGALNTASLAATWHADPARQFVFVAFAQDESPVGLATVVETFAFYANGHYGIINEMYVTPSHRSKGVGAQLIEAVKDMGRHRGWRRIDVTAPESERWTRTKRFYERQHFVFTGPKLKCLLS